MIKNATIYSRLALSVEYKIDPKYSPPIVVLEYFIS